MGASATIELHQLEGWMRNLADGLVRTNFTAAWKRVGVLLGSEMKKNFDEQHSPDGAPWLPIKQYRARGAVGKLRQGQALRDRGLLMASATGRGPNAISRGSASSLEWGTNIGYAHVHQDGATIYPKKGKALAIPLTREAYRVGSPLLFPRPLHVVWPKGRSSGWLVESKPGRKTSGIGAKDIMHYKLAAKVTVPARPFLGVNDRLIEQVCLTLTDFMVNG